MKITIVKWMMICILMVVFSPNQEIKAYTIRGNVSGVKDGTLIDLYVFHLNQGHRIATDTIVNGKFLFEGTVGAEKVYMKLYLKDENHYSGKCCFWVSDTNIDISGNSPYLSQWLVSSDILEQKQENGWMEPIRKCMIAIDSLNLVSVPVERDSREEKIIQQEKDSIFEILETQSLLYLSNQYNSFTAVRELYRFTKIGDSIQKSVVKSIYPKMDTAYLNTLWGEGIKSYFNKGVPPKTGDPFVNFTAYDVNGNVHNLSEYSGKYILLDFWGKTCATCLLSMPEIRQISEKYASKLTVIGVNFDTQKQSWIEFSKNKNITWTNLSDGKGYFGGIACKYGIEGTPTFILINPQGTILDRWEGYQEGLTEEKLSKYWGNK